jgi:tetratricopeptide (TPR) repeat protein/tRNA A-37 threonylcarbamoyl transferase component Bud32
METDYWHRVERVLDLALESDPSDWSTVLSSACDNDQALRDDVEDLLSRLSTAQSFLETPPAATAAALLAEARRLDGPASHEGRRIGAYRIVRQIGRGGMSRVFLAERADGEFTQQVALKLLRPGLDSEIDRHRFRAERQILASLNHPNIARLLDGGVTDEGQPYLVLELVDGTSIDRYCNERGLGVRARLELFVAIADAVQSAHRSLIVHRDLKPSNILVTNDGTVKLLDFGLAKLLEPAYGPNPAPSTATGHRWMTPEYAAPEQIRGTAITTLTDVYQLGAVLHEVLAGHPPFGTRDGSVHELEAAILERDPTPLTGELHGDLDAIVRKALSKEPEERYASAQALADDIRRHLSGQPVIARRQTVGYLARRFVRRHRTALTGAVAATVLLAGYVGTVIADRGRIRRALTEAQAGTRKAEQVTDFMLGLFEAAEGGQSLRDTVTAHALLSRGLERARSLTGQPELKAQMLDVIGRIHTQLGEYDQAKPLLEEALGIRRSLYGDVHPDVATSVEALADASASRRDNAETVRLRREALALRRTISGDDDPKTLDALYALGLALHRAGDVRSAEPAFDQWMTAITRQPRELTENRAHQLTDAASVYESRGNLDRGDSLYREGLAIRRALYGNHHSLVASSLTNLASLIAKKPGGDKPSDSLFREAEDVLRAAYPDGHPSLATTLHLHGRNLQRTNRWAEAEAPLREALEINRRLLGPNSLDVAMSDIDVGFNLAMLGSYREAETLDRDAIRILRTNFDDHNAMVVMARDHLGEALRGQGQFAEAESLLLAGYERFKTPNPVTRSWLGHALNALVRLYDAEGRPDEAAKYRAVLAQPPQTKR